jgi:hypothetical protein
MEWARDHLTESVFSRANSRHRQGPKGPQEGRPRHQRTGQAQGRTRSIPCRRRGRGRGRGGRRRINPSLTFSNDDGRGAIRALSFMAKWTVPPVPENARVRRVITREYVRRNSDTETRYKVKIKPRDPVLLRRSTHHTELFINGVRLKVVTRQQLAKFLDVSYNTIQTWYKQGVFGEPFLMDKDPQGFDRPYWLVSQMFAS